MGGDRKNIKLQPEDHAELKRRKPDDISFGEWLLEATEDYSDTDDDMRDITPTVSLDESSLEAIRDAVADERSGRGSESVSNEDIWGRLDKIAEDVSGLSDDSAQFRH